MAAGDAVEPTAPSERGERRWPMALAVVGVAVLHAILPEQLKVQASPLLPWISVVILAVLIIGDPGRIDRMRTWMRVLTDVLIGLLTLGNAYAAVMLIVGIIQNDSFDQATTLLWAGGVVWISNVVLFALWFWDLDRGGPAARANRLDVPPAFVFPEMLHTDHVRPNWQPAFVDYLSFSFATAMAFSPTDVSAIRPWAKLMCILESLISLALGALVVARAINIIN